MRWALLLLLAGGGLAAYLYWERKHYTLTVPEAEIKVTRAPTRLT